MLVKNFHPNRGQIEWFISFSSYGRKIHKIRECQFDMMMITLSIHVCVCVIWIFFFCFSFYYYLAWYSGMLFVHEITTWWWKQAFQKIEIRSTEKKTKYEMMNDMNEIEKQGFFFILNRPFDVVDMSENVMSCLVDYHHHFFCSKLIKYSFSFHRRWKNWWWWW